MSPDNTHSNSYTPDLRDPDRENLSALFDGELPEDAARFAMRRLDHDTQWRESCGRWQLLGDVLRGQACASAPADFASRVESALAAERARPPAVSDAADQDHAATSPPTRHWSRSRIGGAALAASVAFAALLVVRPGFDDAAPTPVEGAAELASTPVAPASAQTISTAPARAVASVPQVAGPPASDVSGSDPASQLGLAAAAVAVAELPRRAHGQGARASSARSQNQRAGLRQRQSEASTPMVAATAPAPGLTTADAGNAIAAMSPSPTVMAATEPHPFQPQPEEIPTRPWPSATAGDYRAGGAFTASYDLSGAQSRTFYPFEPRLSHRADGDVGAPLGRGAHEAPVQAGQGPYR